MMAAALLKDLGANGVVSSLIVDAGAKEAKGNGCEVKVDAISEGKVSFDRIDESLPFPIPDEARAALSLYPAILELSRYELKVTGLPAPKYELKVNGVSMATLTAKELEAGVNLTAYGKGPIAGQGKEVLAAVAAKEGLVGQWRGLSRLTHAPGATKEVQEKLAQLTKDVEAADAKIRTAARPRKLHFELIASK